MHSATYEGPRQEGREGPSLDLDKRYWSQGLPLPDSWGCEGSVCGGIVVCKRDAETETYVPVLCKRWECDVCSYYKHAWLTRNLVEWQYKLECDRFWTLTLATGGRTAEDSHQEIKRAWAKLRHRLKRRYGDFEFMWVVETTKKGYAHMHVLVNKYFPQPVVSQMWLGITGDSKCVFVERMKGRIAARYIAKYVSKEARVRRASGAVMGTHVFGTSRGVKFPPFMPLTGGSDWKVVPGCWRENATWLRRNCCVMGGAGDSDLRITVLTLHGRPLLKSWLHMPERGP